MVQQTENEHKIKKAMLIINVCFSDRVNKYLQVFSDEKGGSRYNKPSLIKKCCNKKLARTVASGNRSEVHRSQNYPLLNWKIRKRPGGILYRNEQVTALRPAGDFIGQIQRPWLTTHSTSLHSLFRAECKQLINLRHNSSYIWMESAIK